MPPPLHLSMDILHSDDMEDVDQHHESAPPSPEEQPQEKPPQFSAEVWLNYDAAEREFFSADDGRHQDCGQLQHCKYSDPVIEFFNTHGRDMPVEVTWARFTVGTAFQKLAYIDLSTTGTAGEVHVVEYRLATGHRNFFRFIGDAVQKVQDCGIMYGQYYMSMQDLELYASCFVRPEDPPSYEPTFSRSRNLLGGLSYPQQTYYEPEQGQASWGTLTGGWGQ